MVGVIFEDASPVQRIDRRSAPGAVIFVAGRPAGSGSVSAVRLPRPSYSNQSSPHATAGRHRPLPHATGTVVIIPCRDLTGRREGRDLILQHAGRAIGSGGCGCLRHRPARPAGRARHRRSGSPWLDCRSVAARVATVAASSIDTCVSQRIVQHAAIGVIIIAGDIVSAIDGEAHLPCRIAQRADGPSPPLALRAPTGPFGLDGNDDPVGRRCAYTVDRTCCPVRS